MSASSSVAGPPASSQPTEGSSPWSYFSGYIPLFVCILCYESEQHRYSSTFLRASMAMFPTLLIGLQAFFSYHWYLSAKSGEGMLYTGVVAVISLVLPSLLAAAVYDHLSKREGRGAIEGMARLWHYIVKRVRLKLESDAT